jgi:hypothetical protein
VAEPYEIGIDVERSFAQGSSGFLAKRIILNDGTEALDEYFWRYGQAAYNAILEADYLADSQTYRSDCGYGNERSDYGIFVEQLMLCCDYIQPVAIKLIEFSAWPDEAKAINLLPFKKWDELKGLEKMFAVSFFWQGYGSVRVAISLVDATIAGEETTGEAAQIAFFKSVCASTALHLIYSMVEAYKAGDILQFGRLASMLESVSPKPMKLVNDIGLAKVAINSEVKDIRKKAINNGKKGGAIGGKKPKVKVLPAENTKGEWIAAAKKYCEERGDASRLHGHLLSEFRKESTERMVKNFIDELRKNEEFKRYF